MARDDLIDRQRPRADHLDVLSKPSAAPGLGWIGRRWRCDRVCKFPCA
jgi:hypothetical protein